MRRFFSIFKSSHQMNHTEVPSLPLDLSYSDMVHKTNRGFLARKIGQYLDLDAKDWDTLFFCALRTSRFTYPNHENQIELILYLSDQLLEWHEQKKDILSKIKNLELGMKIQNALLKVYEIHKKDLFLEVSATNHQKLPAKSEELKEWKVYRDVMFASTQGKFLLITKEDVNRYKKGSVFCEGTITKSTDIPVCRNAAKESLEQIEVSRATIMSWLLVLSEAITNTIKHAERGKMTLIKDEDNNEIRFVIEDDGPGFSLEDLPKKVLLAGYSTKKSMGQGFTLMMKIAKQILLSTTPRGSTIILTFDLGNRKEDY